MKFSEADAGGGHLIEGYSADWISISGRRYTRSLILTPSDIIEPIAQDPEKAAAV